MKFFSILSILAVLLIGCSNEDQIYSKHKELSKGAVWNQVDEVFFKVEVDDIDADYSVKYMFRHMEGFSYKDLNIVVTEISPSKKEFVSEYAVNVVDENGEYTGGNAMSVIDCESVVEEHKRFSEKGIYIFKVAHMMPVEEVTYSLELGLEIVKNN